MNLQDELATELLESGRPVYSFGTPTRRWVLWHVTSGCNIECKYCYGSFQGGSYKHNYRVENDVPLANMLDAADDVARLGFESVHICGGEPFLRRDLWKIIERLTSHGIRVWVLTNATFVSPSLEAGLQLNQIECLAVSLDALDPDYGDMVREKTSAVMTNVQHFSRMLKAHKLKTMLGLYVVLTKKNLNLVPELLTWAEKIGVQYINMQAVYLPRHHSLHQELTLTRDDYPEVEALLRRLIDLKGNVRTSSNALVELTRFLFLHNDLAVKSCFADRGDFLYIDGHGDVFGCPSKPPMANPSLGNIRNRQLIDIAELMQTRSQVTTCAHVSLDCLGMYEMAFQDI